MVIYVNLNKIKELIPEKYDEAFYVHIKGKIFIFDKESYQEYKQFKDSIHDIDVIDGYLARRLKGDFNQITYFHRWLMQGEIDQFCIDKGCSKVEVHHLTYCKIINIKKYLKVVTKEEHDKLHWSEISDRIYSGLFIRECEEWKIKNQMEYYSAKPLILDYLND